MPALRKLVSSTYHITSHRTYHDPEVSSNVVFCSLVRDEDDLVQLAAGIDRIEVRQAPGGLAISQTITTTITQALRRIDLVGGSADPLAEQVSREMRRCLIDALARIRIRWNRRLLAGVMRSPIGSDERRVLVLAFVRPGISSCEWHVAISA